VVIDRIRQWLLPEIGGLEDAEPRYGLVLFLILATLATTALLADTEWGVLAVAIMQGATFVLALRLSGARHIVQAVGVLDVVAVLLAAAVSSVTLQSGVAAGIHIVTSLFALATPFAIASRLRSFKRIGREAVMAALCVYLTVGFFFVAVFGVVNAISSTPIFVQIQEPDKVDMLYFSYVTLTTVGYGDLSANVDSIRMLAIMEALIGQLYLVSVVGLIVGNIGATRSHGPLNSPPADHPVPPADST
jgi:hypothetical protein